MALCGYITYYGSVIPRDAPRRARSLANRNLLTDSSMPLRDCVMLDKYVTRSESLYSWRMYTGRIKHRHGKFNQSHVGVDVEPPVQTIAYRQELRMELIRVHRWQHGANGRNLPQQCMVWCCSTVLGGADK